MGYDLSTPERYIQRLTRSIPFALKTMGWNDIIVLARQEVGQPEFNPTRFWVVVDEEDNDKMGLVLEESTDESNTICVIDMEEPTLTEAQIEILKLMHRMTTPGFSID